MTFQAPKGRGSPRHLKVSGQKPMNAALLRTGCTALLTVALIATAPMAFAQWFPDFKIDIDQIRPPTTPGVRRAVPQPRKITLCMRSEDRTCVDRETIRNLQAALNILGYDAGAVDGLYGAKTSRAFEAFRKTHGKTITGPPSNAEVLHIFCLLYTSPSPRDRQKSRMPSSA